MIETVPAAPELIFRQGDVLLRQISAIPGSVVEVAREDGRIVLAHGEVTGHAHVIDAPAEEAAYMRAGEERRFLRLMRGVELRHEEHAAISLPAGLYQVIRQREWTDAEADEENWRYAGD